MTRSPEFSRNGTRSRGSKALGWLVKLAAGALFLAGLVIFTEGIWIKGKAALAQLLLDHAFLASVERPVKPWPWADTAPFAKISAPRLAAGNIVLSGTSGEALAFGPGHLAGSARPGERGTTVFAAHRDTHFAWIGKLRPGDKVAVETPGGVRVDYVIRRAWVARFDASGIDADSDERLIALTTCWPLDARTPGPLRYIVEGVAVKTDGEQGI